MCGDTPLLYQRAAEAQACVSGSALSNPRCADGSTGVAAALQPSPHTLTRFSFGVSSHVSLPSSPSLRSFRTRCSTSELLAEHASVFPNLLKAAGGGVVDDGGGGETATPAPAAYQAGNRLGGLQRTRISPPPPRAGGIGGYGAPSMVSGVADPPPPFPFNTAVTCTPPTSHTHPG
jgi:hypothetical protein